MNTSTDAYDVIVVGGGNAALCAALSAQEEGAKVLLLERATVAERGGNSAYTDGAMRFAYNGAEDIIALSGDLTPAEIAASDFGAYTEEQFFDDMARITQNRTDPDLCEILVRNSNAALRWMQRQGVKFMPNIKDGRCTTGLAIPKSNWANTIETPPFEAYAVTCGVTFTYGGIRITTGGQVINTNHEPVPGLFTAGEMVGGIFYFNCPASTGLTSGAVFGRLAGRSAAAFARSAKAAA